MIQGRFGDTTTTPFVEASIYFPRLSVSGYVSFLADTGASGTVLMPADSKKLAINFSRLRNPRSSRTVGGPARGFMEQAVLGFLDRASNEVYGYNVEIPSV
jgi:hypothetical protein